MADYLAGFYPEWVDKEENPRQIILDLGKMITNRIPVKLGFQKLNKYDPEYWGLATLLTDEQAEVALKMGVRKPKTMADMVKLTGKSEEELEKILGDMSFMGILEYNWENPTRTKQWVLPMFVPGSAEFTNMNDTILKKYPEMGRFFERMSRLPLEKVTPMVPPGGAGIGMHVIPVEKAIETENQSISVEHISHWLDKYEGKYAASPCSCRKSRLTFDEGCADDPEGWCVAVGDMADYVVETGKGGRYITKEEALEIFRKGEENGFVHQITNIDGADKIFAICNCNINVCYALRTSQLFNTPNLSRSAYVARVEKDDCVACGKCVEVCPAGAVKLGQKLCTKDGKQVEYPKHPLPSEMKWGPHMWDENYRDNNRINCYDTGTAPCKTACPAHIAVQGYLKMAAQGRYTEALALIKKDNPLPAICGRICDRRCEDACTRGSIDQAIAIDEVKKFIAQQDLDAETRYIPKKVVPSLNGSFSEKVAIIGAGPAGLSCAFYLAEKGYSPVIFEKNEKPGGMLRYGIPAYRLPREILDAEIASLLSVGIDAKVNVDIGDEITFDELRGQYDALYLALGAHTDKKTGIEGEDAEGVISAVEMLREIGDDHMPDFRGKEIVVIGGGNVAMDVCRSAVRLGARKVSCVYRRRREDMTALPEEVEGAVAEGVELVTLQAPVRIETNGQGHAVALWTQPQIIGEMDDKGRPKPEKAKLFEKRIAADGIVVAIGQGVETHGFEQSKITIKRGAFVAEASGQIDNMDGVFAGGDCVTGPATVIRAIAAGKVAAANIDEYLGYHHVIDVGVEVPTARLNNKPPHGRINTTEREADERKRDFKCIECGLTDEEAYAEASRCLRCDHFGYGIFRGGRKGKW